MSIIAPSNTEELIQAYVDSQLGPEDIARIEKLITNDPALAQKIKDYQNQNALMHELYDPIQNEPIPTHFNDIYAENKNNRYWIKAVASIALFLLGSVTGWFIKDYNTKTYLNVVNLPQSATQAHMVYVPEVKHPVEVNADQEQHLIKWLSKRLGKSIKAPKLDSFGFQLVGGRLLPSDTGPAAQFMYENLTGNRLTLFVRTRSDAEQNTAFHYYKEKQMNAFYWIDGNLGYVIVGNLNRSDLLDTANTIYEQLSL